MASAALVRSLADQLRTRNEESDNLYGDYYSGRHRLAYATSKYRDAFGTLFEAFSINYLSMVVDTLCGRIEVAGFASDDPDDADNAWRAWLDLGLDGSSSTAFRQACIYGEAYLLADPANKSVTIEDSRQMIVVRNPARPTELLAALKVYVAADGFGYAVLYEPEEISAYKSTDKLRTDLGTNLDRIEWGRVGDPEPNSLGEVPVFVLPHSPDAASQGRSQLESLLPIQDAINKLGNDLIIASEFQAFRQRVLTGVEIPKDADGNPVSSAQLTASMSRLWAFEDSDAKVHDLEPASLANYRDGLEVFIGSLCSISATPPTYIVSASGQSLSNVSGEAVAALESAHVSHAEECMRLWRQPLSRALRLALGIEGRLDLEWRPVQRPSIATVADAAVKLRSVNVSLEEVWRLCGFNPTQIAEMRARLDSGVV